MADRANRGAPAPRPHVRPVHVCRFARRVSAGAPKEGRKVIRTNGIQDESVHTQRTYMGLSLGSPPPLKEVGAA